MNPQAHIRSLPPKGVVPCLGRPGAALTTDNMLAALIDGRALTASELAAEAGVTKQTASSHLAQLSKGGSAPSNNSPKRGVFAQKPTASTLPKVPNSVFALGNA